MLRAFVFAGILAALPGLPGCKLGASLQTGPCVANDDCVLTTQGSDCCFGCESTAALGTSSTARQVRCAEKSTGPASNSCPVQKCVPRAEAAYCIDERCQLRAL